MRATVHDEMRTKMDTGVRVNPALANAFGVGGASGQGVDLLAAAHADDSSSDGDDGAAALELLDW